MWNNKEQLKDSIDSISEYIGLGEKYQTELNSPNTSITQIVKMLIYDMFLNKFNQTTCPLNLYAYYTIIHDYVTELENNGFVEYSKN
jgi:hypothetical protein